MGKVEIRYYVTRGGDKPGTRKMGYWAPCLARRSKITGQIEPTLMAQLGFELVDLGVDGPKAWAMAESWNKKWDQVYAAYRAGKVTVNPKKFVRIYPPDSIGEGWARLRATGVWAAKAKRTREDWERGWKYIEPIFGDVTPRSISLDDMSLWYLGDPNNEVVKGLLQVIGVRESHRAVKIWRALWEVLGTIKRDDGEMYVVGKDPSLGIRRKTPKPRKDFWYYDEARILVKGAWRKEFRGLSAALATSWDTMMSPIDVRSLTLLQLTPRPHGPLSEALSKAGIRKSRLDANGALFELDRAKTGRGAIGTLSRRTERLLAAYLTSLPFTLHPDTPIFHTRGGQTGPRGGKPRPPVPYTKDSIGADFREIRGIFFPEDKRQISDFRRSGAIEATAGKVDPAALAGKMSNTIDSNAELQRTYTPHTATLVRMADAARTIGRHVMRDSKKGSNS